MKNRPIISIIVPVYNVESYLERCIESILNQSFKEFELILVNDGSTDGCKDICNEYKTKDKSQSAGSMTRPVLWLFVFKNPPLSRELHGA